MAQKESDINTNEAEEEVQEKPPPKRPRPTPTVPTTSSPECCARRVRDDHLRRVRTARVPKPQPLHQKHRGMFKFPHAKWILIAAATRTPRQERCSEIGLSSCVTRRRIKPPD
jgi:hypothetical protein